MTKLYDYNSFLEGNRLKYYSFDWDDNILHMPTVIHMDKFVDNKWTPVDVKPSEFALIRHDPNYRARNNNINEAYKEFKDYGPRGNKAFVEDIQKALNESNFGPSWNKFVKCLTNASLFSIITARGHEYDTIKDGIKYLIDNTFTDKEKDIMYNNCQKFSHLFDNKTYKRNNKIKFTENELIKVYLNCCKYYGVGAPFSKSIQEDFNFDENISIEEAKKIAIGRFIDICNQYGEKLDIDVSFGFSDDDKRNVEHIKSYFEYNSSIYNRIKFSIYDTSNKQSVKTIFESTLDNNSSILRFTSFNSMNNNLQNATNDFSQPNYTMLQKSKIANFLTKKKNKKFAGFKRKNKKSVK